MRGDSNGQPVRGVRPRHRDVLRRHGLRGARPGGPGALLRRLEPTGRASTVRRRGAGGGVAGTPPQLARGVGGGARGGGRRLVRRGRGRGDSRPPASSGRSSSGSLSARRSATRSACRSLAVHHLEGHLFSPLLGDGRPRGRPVPESMLGLVVSGGHTSLLAVDGPSGAVTSLAETRDDDAIGEAFDKIGHRVGLPFPGGAEVDRLAELGNPAAFPFRVASIKSRELAFSYSGLKSQALRALGEIEAGNGGASEGPMVAQAAPASRPARSPGRLRRQPAGAPAHPVAGVDRAGSPVDRRVLAAGGARPVRRFPARCGRAVDRPSGPALRRTAGRAAFGIGRRGGEPAAAARSGRLGRTPGARRSCSFRSATAATTPR